MWTSTPAGTTPCSAADTASITSGTTAASIDVTFNTTCSITNVGLGAAGSAKNTLDISGGSLSTSSFVNINNQSGNELKVNGGSLSVGGQLGVARGLTVNSGSVTAATATVTGTGVTNMTGGTFNATTSYTQSSTASTTVSGGSFTTKNYTQTASASSTTNISGGSFTVTGTFAQAANLNVSNGATVNVGTLAVTGGSTTFGSTSDKISVSTDYTNSSFGAGNSFNALATVTVTGGSSSSRPIVATGNAKQGLSVNGGATDTSGTATLAMGNIHVGGSSTGSYKIVNAGTTGPSIRGAIQTIGTGNISGGALTGSGVTAANYTANTGAGTGLATGASTTAYNVTFTTTSAGALSGQAVQIVDNFGDKQTLSITGAAYSYASASHSPEPVNFGNVHVGDSANKNVSLTNTAADGSYSDGLRGSWGGTAGDAQSATGSTGLIAAGSTDSSSLSVGLNTSTAGHRTGTASLTLVSDGTAVGLGTSALTAQTVNVQGDVYSYATGSHSPDPVDFGKHHVGDVVASQKVTLSNTAADGSYSEGLIGSMGSTTGAAQSAAGTTGLIAAGSSDSSSLSVGFNTSTAGHRTGTATLSLTSDGTGTSGLGTSALTAQTVNVQGDVYSYASASHSPEPVNFGSVHINDVVASKNVTLSNVAADGSYSESLTGSLGGATGAAQSATGTTGLIAAGSSDSTSLSIGVKTNVAGAGKTGSATLTLISDGSTTSGLGTTALASQTVNTTVDVYDYANAALKLNASSSGGVTLTPDGTAATTYTLNLGHLALGAGGGSVHADFNTLNLPSFADLLGGTWSAGTNGGTGVINYTLNDFTAASGPNSRVAGGGSSIGSSVSVSTTSVGTFSGQTTLTWDGYNAFIGGGWFGTASGGQNSFLTITLNIVGDVYNPDSGGVPEPGILWLFGSAGFGAWANSRRKKAANA